MDVAGEECDAELGAKLARAHDDGKQIRVPVEVSQLVSELEGSWLSASACASAERRHPRSEADSTVRLLESCHLEEDCCAGSARRDHREQEAFGPASPCDASPRKTEAW